MTFPRTATAILVVLVCMIALGGCGGDDSTSSPFDAQMENVVELGIPGVAVRVNDGSGTQFHTRGVANIEKDDEIELANHFRVASVSKAFNGVVILSLVREGKLRLSEKAGKWLADELPRARNVTIAQMMQHTGGIPDYTNQPDFGEALRTDPQQTLPPRELLGFVTDVPLDFEPGTQYAYSDTDNIALGLIAEAVSGESYDELLDKYAYKKITAKGTSLPQSSALPEPFTSGYQLIPGEEGTGDPEDVTKALNPELAWASGGIVSTLDDLGSLFESIASGRLYGDRLVEKQREGVEGQSSPPGPGENVAGLSLFGYKTRCGTFWGHTGSFPGYRVFAAADETGDKSAVVYANATETSAEAADAITELQEAVLCSIGQPRRGATGTAGD